VGNIFSGTNSPGLSQPKGRKMIVVVVCILNRPIWIQINNVEYCQILSDMFSYKKLHHMF